MSEYKLPSPILFDAATAYANDTADVSIRLDLRGAFIAGADWQLDRVSDSANDIERLTTENAELRSGEYLVKVVEERESLRRYISESPAPQTHVAGSADSLVSAVFNELGEAEYKLARWNPASDPWHYWSREAIENAIRSVVATHSMDGSRSLPFDRDTLGRFVREAWVRWAETQPEPKSSWLVPYDELSEPDKEADRQIGEAVARWTLIGDAARPALATEGK
jgi:hypothetical protein